MTAPPVTDVFAALGDPVRQGLVEVLAGKGAASATTLAGPLAVTRQAVDRHLRVLDRAGLVTSQRGGREVLWSMRRDRLHQPAEWIAEVAAQWDRRLLAVKQAAEGPR